MLRALSAPDRKLIAGRPAPSGLAGARFGPLGAVPRGAGLVEFRVWAPDAEEVAVELAGGTRPLGREPEGTFAGRLPAGPGDDYRFLLDGRSLADPCSRWQPAGLRGASRILDPAAFVWTADAPSLDLASLVVYELHVGTFTPEGTFDAAVARLPSLRELGVTAIELMPVATFPGERGWGYDGVFTSAPHRAYGGPHGLARLVDAAHANGLGGHPRRRLQPPRAGLGARHRLRPVLHRPGRDLLGRRDRLLGRGRCPGVGDPERGALGVRDYHVDGLRLDAVARDRRRERAARRDGAGRRVRAARPGALVIAEMALGDRRPIEVWGADAEWDDGLHHALHVLVTGERDGYYEPYGRVTDLARAFAARPADRLVVCAQNHDQVGNRAFGDRLRRRCAGSRPPACSSRRRSRCCSWARSTTRRSPFQFFTDHDRPADRRGDTEGRRQEFESVRGLRRGRRPGPAGRVDVRALAARPLVARPASYRAFYAELLRLRRTLPRETTTTVDEERRILRVRRGGVELVRRLRAPHGRRSSR